MTSFILRILSLTLGMSVVIAVLFLMSKLAGEKFTAKCRYFIWAAVLLRLALPIDFSEGWLLQIEVPTELESAALQDVTEPEVQTRAAETLRETVRSAEASAEREYTAPSAEADVNEYAPPVVNVVQESREAQPVETTPVQERIPETQASPVMPQVLAAAETGEITEPENAETTVQYSAIMLPEAVYVVAAEEMIEKELINTQALLRFLAVVYLIGAAVYVIVRISSHNAYTHTVSRWKKRVSHELYEEYHRLCDEMKIRRHPVLYSSERADSPMLFGYFRPTIVLPAAVTDVDASSGILAHELTHYKRGDIWLKLISMLAEGLHWFNPLVHMAAKRCEQEMELACDEAVLRGLDKNARVTYGYAMLDIVKKCRNRRNTLTTQYSPRKTAVRERFDNILDTRNKHRGILLITLAVVLCTAAGFAVSCNVAQEQEGPEVGQENEVTDDAVSAEFEGNSKSVIQALTDEERAAMHDHISNIVSQIETVQEKIEKCQIEKEELENSLADIALQLAIVEKQYDGLDSAYADEKAAVYSVIEKYEYQMAELKDRVKRTEAEIAELEAQRERLTQQLMEEREIYSIDTTYQEFDILVMTPEEYIGKVNVNGFRSSRKNGFVVMYSKSGEEGQLTNVLYYIVRHRPEDIAAYLSNDDIYTYFAHDGYYWYATLLPQGRQKEIDSHTLTAEYSEIYGALDGVKRAFINMNDLTEVDNEYAAEMAEYYAQTPCELYNGMTSADDWETVIDAIVVRIDAIERVNGFLKTMREGGNIAKLDGLAEDAVIDLDIGEAKVPPYITADQINELHTIEDGTPVITLHFGDTAVKLKLDVMPCTEECEAVDTTSLQYCTCADGFESGEWLNHLVITEITSEPDPVTTEEPDETSAADLQEYYNSLSRLSDELEALQSKEMGAEQRYDEVISKTSEIIKLYCRLVNEQSRIYSQTEELESLQLRIIAGDIYPEEDADALAEAYDERSAEIEKLKAEYDEYERAAEAVKNEYILWRDYRYTLEAGFYAAPADDSTDALIGQYIDGELPMHMLMEYESVREEAVALLNQVMYAVIAGDFDNELFRFADTAPFVLLYGSELPESITAEYVGEVFEEFELDSGEEYRFVIPVSEVSELVVGFEVLDYHNEPGFYITKLYQRITQDDFDPSAAVAQLEENYEVEGVPESIALSDYEAKVCFAAYNTDGEAPQLYFTMDGKKFYQALIELPEEYDSADIVCMYGRTNSVQVICEFEKNGVYTYGYYYDSGTFFDGALSADEFRLTGGYTEPADYVKFPCTNYPNMTDDITDHITLGVERDDVCYLLAAEELADEENYVIWNDGSALHITVTDENKCREYKMVRRSNPYEDGTASVTDDFPTARYLYDRALELGITTNGYYYLTEFYLTARALLASDCEQLEWLLNLEDGSIFDTFKVSSWDLELVGEEGNRYALLDLTVTGSDVERFPVGRYTLKLTEGMNGVYITKEGETPARYSSELSGAEYALMSWLNLTGQEIIPLDGDMSGTDPEIFAQNVTQYIAYHYGNDTQITLDEIRSLMETVFGSDEYLREDKLISDDGVHYSLPGQCGASIWYDFVSETVNEDGSVTIGVVFYEEYNLIDKTNYIEYTLRDSGDEFGGVPVYAFVNCTVKETY